MKNGIMNERKLNERKCKKGRENRAKGGIFYLHETTFSNIFDSNKGERASQIS